MHTDCTGQWCCSDRQLFFSPSLVHPLFLFPSITLTQTNQCTCVLTPKSQSLTCPRVFTSILEGLTSAKTNCLIELQHQHSVACLYKLLSVLLLFFFLTQSLRTTVLTSMKYFQAPKIRQAFDYLQRQTKEKL